MARPEKFAIALLPDVATSRRAVEANRLLQLVAVEPKLELGPGAIPHISLFHLMLDPDRLDELAVAIRMRVAGRRKFLCEFYPHLNVASDGYIFWDVLNAPQVRDLGDDVLEVAAPMRAGDMEISWSMNDDQKTMHAKYGYPTVGTSFRPHITVSVVKPGVLSAGTIPWGDYFWKWNSDQVIIGRLGQRYGTLISIERTITLG